MDDNEHSCIGNSAPVVDGYDPDAEEPILSAAIGNGDLTVYAVCQKCDRRLNIDYELVEARPLRQ